MRWQGTIAAIKLLEHAVPTALTAPADPARFARSEYDQVFPTGILRISFHTD